MKIDFDTTGEGKIQPQSRIILRKSLDIRRRFNY
jgi:hypothetical protein